ncbi:hypothetical protein L6164_016662 [Bauhinia variegata]|uniref:Uncharacterized protein n=1 Tax=Bauhinia variegata TaxID=167791 RepID=A0ACB9NPC6_BAUVA|nr:hypothetical protein L6164_016662 [Bauhinia variegata]
MEPLIDDLKMLWKERVETFNVSLRQNFVKHAALIWTINDYPAYRIISQFLPLNHPYRKNKSSFKKRCEEHSLIPKRFSGEEIWEMVCGYERGKVARYEKSRFPCVHATVLPIGFDTLPRPICKPLVELSIFFRNLTSTLLKVDHLKSMEKNIPIILCKLEQIFPLSFLIQWSIFLSTCLVKPELVV